MGNSSPPRKKTYGDDYQPQPQYRTSSTSYHDKPSYALTSDDLKNRCMDLQAQVSQLYKKIDSLSDQRYKLNRELEASRKRISELESLPRSESSQSNGPNLREQIAQKEAEIKQLKLQVKLKEGEIQELKTKQAKPVPVDDTDKTELAFYKKEYETQAKLFQLLQTENSKLRAENTELKKQNEGLSVENSFLQEIVDSATSMSEMSLK